MDWVKVEHTSNWLIGSNGKGKKTSMAIKTAKIQLYEELVDRIQRDHGMSLISYISIRLVCGRTKTKPWHLFNSS